MANMLTNLQGIIVASITPRRPSGHEIDLGAALEVIDYLSASGVSGIALLGSTGEFLHFDVEDRIHLVILAAKRTRLPLVVNVSHSSLDGAVRLAQEAASAGASGLVLMPPYFFPYGQEEIREFYLEFARQTNLSLPMLLYNIPFFTSEIARDTAMALLATGLFAGIKDSSGSREYFDALREFRGSSPFSLFVGNDVLFTQGRSAGADGVVSGVACAVPELVLALDAAIQGGAEQKTARLEARLQEFIAWINRFPVPVGVREATAARGLKTGPLATPLGAGSRRKLDEFREWFTAWLPVVQMEARSD